MFYSPDTKPNEEPSGIDINICRHDHHFRIHIVNLGSLCYYPPLQASIEDPVQPVLKLHVQPAHNLGSNH